MSAAFDEYLRSRMNEVLTQQRPPALALGVARPGGELHLVSGGVADIDSGQLMEAETAFRIGSVTKTFTAALTLLLAERGHLSLDKPVEEYLPGTAVGRPLIRQLLSHSSGLQREAPHPMWASMQGPDRAEFLELLARAEFVDEPGVRWAYSNLGYAVLGQVIAAVTGQTCEDLIDHELLKPLGLNSTTWQPTGQAAAGYRLDPYQHRVLPEPVMDQGVIGVGGQLWSTITDLLTWGDALMGGAPEVIPASVVEAMHRPQVMVDQRSWTQGWGLGLILNRREGTVLSGHTGAMPGFLASMTLDRQSRTVVVALANVTRGVRLGELTVEILEELARTTPSSSVVETVDASGRSSCPAELVGVLGRWWSESEETVFTWRSDALHAHLAETECSSVTRFDRTAADEYRAVEGRAQGERLLVRRDSAGAVQTLEWATYPYSRDPM
ncbi:serine hydrolase domain-containing protein [Kineosporia babensis]|uniref:Beta-lactamase family protein n=1 Tax=Kineosporia babensis TaxID=499548 RepID=A0A9X1SXE5_9ACTN|nr:serine hydrolase domain-containing protein [Kineosporia babensis]MCD5316137.1 beta-lactamase family protein [Kineosporia babensis]